MLARELLRNHPAEVRERLATRGVEVPRDPNGAILRPCEIHPSFALGPPDLPDDVTNRVQEEGPVYLE